MFYHFRFKELTMKFIKQAAAVAFLINRRKNKIKNKMWVHPLVSQRLLKGQFHKLFEDLCIYQSKFVNYFRMMLVYRAGLFSTSIIHFSVSKYLNDIFNIIFKLILI